MKIKSMLKKCLAALTSCVILSVAAPVPAISEAAGNIISNSTFDSGTSGWGTYKQSGGACSLSTSNGMLALNITNVGSVNYAVQVFYDIIPLYQNGVYRLKYDISCSTNRYIEGMIQQNGGTYQAYTWTGIDVSPTPQTIDYTFTMSYETDIMSKLVFNCGTQGSSIAAHTIYLDNVYLELVDDSKVDYGANKPYECSIITNQLGFKTDDTKTAVIRNASSKPASCNVVNAQTKQVVYTGTPGNAISNSTANETNYIFDFSSVTQPGTYYISCDGLDNSYNFVIGDNPYGNLFDDSVRMLYLQRCGTAVSDNTFGHVACHTSMATVYGTNQTIDVSGGWHDAGDYGRYIVPAAKSIADLLYAYERNPQLFSDNIGIPESGNGIPDVLDEVRFELEWMLKMQSSNGGVYHKVTCANFPGYIMPENEGGQLIVTPVSTTATADFCASMAMAYEFYIDIDAAFANKCLDAAKKAWSYLESNPDLVFSNPGDITTGEYGDTNDRDERYWAAAQMYRATGESQYLTKAESYGIRKGMDWALVGDYGNIAILTMDGVDTSSTLYTRARSTVISQANTFASTSQKVAYGVAITKFNWGSNMTVANAGVILGIAYDITGEDRYDVAAHAQLNYLLGNNPLGTSFVTGYGTVSPLNPHHRPSMAKGTAMIGMLVGGVNQNLEDSAAKAYLADAPSAKCYVDNAESYSTNEITIYWNSPFTYLMTLINSEDEYIVGDINEDGKFDVYDLDMLNTFLHKSGDVTNYKKGDLVEDGELNVMDAFAMKKMLIYG